MELVSNTATSLDGRTGLAADPRARLGSAEDLRRMRRLRASADAVLLGGETFRTWPLGLVAEPPKPLLMAVLTRRGLLSAAERWRPKKGVQLLVLGGSDLDAPAHRRAFGAEVLTTAAPSLAWAVAELARRGCQRTILEGGGQLVHAAIAADLLDALHLTLCAEVLGGPQPGLVEGPTLRAELRRFQLESCEVVGNEVYLRYRRACARAGSAPVRLGTGS